MNVSLNFLSRIAGMLLLAYLGNRIGVSLSGLEPSVSATLATQLLTLAGAGLGLLTTHHWTIEPVARAITYVRGISLEELLTLTIGALVGLIFGLLLAVPVGYLPPPLGQFLPIIFAVLLAYGGALVARGRRTDFARLLRTSRAQSLVVPPQLIDAMKPPKRYLVDTSAIIDGRIAQVSETGFLEGKLLVPRFVLNELQLLADSSDELRRGKGRRGLDILNEMQKGATVPVEVLDTELKTNEPVDNRLVTLAQQYNCPLITNDYNLGRVAKLHGVHVLSLNQLADAVRPPVIPGQDIHVIIRDVGREREQGISFLDDGTMVVVEDARALIGKEVDVTVTRVHQTQTGRIVFAHTHNGKHP